MSAINARVLHFPWGFLDLCGFLRSDKKLLERAPQHQAVVLFKTVMFCQPVPADLFKSRQLDTVMVSRLLLRPERPRRGG